MRLGSFMLYLRTGTQDPALSESIAYLDELVAWQIRGTTIRANYNKLNIMLRERDAVSHGQVAVYAGNPRVAEIDYGLPDESILLGPEPELRTAALAVVDDALHFLTGDLVLGSAELLEVIRAAWLARPPHRIALHRSRKRHGQGWFRGYYAFGRDHARIEVDLQDRDGTIRTVTFREEEGFRSCWLLLPRGQFKSAPDGIALEDSTGHRLGLLPAPRVGPHS